MDEIDPTVPINTSPLVTDTEFNADFQQVATDVLGMIIFPDIILDNLADNE